MGRWVDLNMAYLMRVYGSCGEEDNIRMATLGRL